MEYNYLSLLSRRYIVAVTVVICPTTINFCEQEVKSANRRNPCFSLANRYADHFRLFAMNINVYKNLQLIDQYIPQYVEMIQSKFPEPWGELSMHYTSYDSTESNKTLIEACPQDLQPSHRTNYDHYLSSVKTSATFTLVYMVLLVGSISYFWQRI